MTASHRFTLPVARECEELLQRELVGLGLKAKVVGRGAVGFDGTLEDGYRACLWSRVASRVLLHLDHFPAESADALYEGVKRQPWAEHLSPDGSMAVHCTGRTEGITHTGFAAQRVKDAVVDTLRKPDGTRPSVDLEAPDLLLNVHLHRRMASLSVDLSGPSLHIRNTRIEGGVSPLKETLAAALLYLADWPRAAAKGTPFVDPMCGAGTLLTEAAGIALGRAPGLRRTQWGFVGWRGHDRAVWRRLLAEAMHQEKVTEDKKLRIYGFDSDKNRVRGARINVAQSELGAFVRLKVRTFQDLRPPTNWPGILVANPPYGKRLGHDQDMGRFYREMGNHLRRTFLGWTAWLIVQKDSAAGRLGLRPKRRIPIWNGPIECRFLEVPISDKAVQGRGPGWNRTDPAPDDSELPGGEEPAGKGTDEPPSDAG